MVDGQPHCLNRKSSSVPSPIQPPMRIRTHIERPVRGKTYLFRIFLLVGTTRPARRARDRTRARKRDVEIKGRRRVMINAKDRLPMTSERHMRPNIVAIITCYNIHVFAREWPRRGAAKDHRCERPSADFLARHVRATSDRKNERDASATPCPIAMICGFR